MIRELYKYDLGCELKQVRSVPVSMGADKEEAILFIYSNTDCIDPYRELFNFPEDTLKLALFTLKGELIWKKDLGRGVIPGIWFAPVISFDLDGDGTDEIWYVGNTLENLPFSFKGRVLERIDPHTGETTGQWPWPQYPMNENMEYTYRYYLGGGYVHNKPVLITMQGTYQNLHLQGYNPGMEKRWEVNIKPDDPGSRASHVFPIIDFNDDGIDEIFWGERLLSVDDGHELFCGDKKDFCGHTDIIIPFTDENNKHKYVFAGRESNDKKDDVNRIVIYNSDGSIRWADINHGHMHQCWIANIGENRRRIAMAWDANNKTGPALYYYDAIDGTPVDFKLPYKGNELMPVDFNGDGYHEFVGIKGEMLGKVIDRFGNELADLYSDRLGPSLLSGMHCQVRTGKILDLPGQQVMLFYRKEGVVRIWGDDEAVDMFPDERKNRYHRFMQHMMGAGYHCINGVISCGM